MTKVTRTLPRDVYETLYLAALAEGGIGAGEYFENATNYPDKGYAPVCAIGLGRFIAGASSGGYFDDVPYSIREDYDVEAALRNAGIGELASDEAVYAINARRLGIKLKRSDFDDETRFKSEKDRLRVSGRVSFKLWARELGIVPDDSESEYGTDFVTPKSELKRRQLTQIVESETPDSVVVGL